LTPEDKGYPLLQKSLCIEHQEAIRLGERWRYHVEDETILMGKDIEIAGSLLAVDFKGFSADMETVAAGGATMLRAVFEGDDGGLIRLMFDREVLRKLVEWAEVRLED
jgi:hypothetical protein